ncbi:hypothetical protein [Azospirillum argentinense]
MGALSSWCPPPEPAAEAIRLRVLSLGAGVQSTTLALMATHGIIDPPRQDGDGPGVQAGGRSDASGERRHEAMVRTTRRASALSSM